MTTAARSIARTALTTSLALVALGASAADPALRARPAEVLHGHALESFRKGRFAEAYGRFIMLADAGHPASARYALFMYQHGTALFGREWDSTQDQLDAWARLSQQQAPQMAAIAYAPAVQPVAQRQRTR
jgi:hypothetical protein